MADPWQECMDYAVILARQAGEMIREALKNEMGIHCWDMAGAGIIVTEAGGVLMDVTGGPFDLMSRRIIAANSITLAKRIAKEIEIIPLQRDDES